MPDPTFETLVPKAPEGRFNGIKRAYTPADVAKLRGSVSICHTPAEMGANRRLWKIPVEFTLHDKGATTDWIGPQVDGGGAMIYINAAPLKGVPSQVVYNANFKSKQEDRNYTEVVPVKVKFGNKTVPAFRCKEANHKPGSPDSKAPDDIHRWHLFVFGNEMVYTLGFTGPFSAFQANKLQSAFEPVIQAVELIAITQ